MENMKHKIIVIVISIYISAQHLTEAVSKLEDSDLEACHCKNKAVLLSSTDGAEKHLKGKKFI